MKHSLFHWSPTIRICWKRSGRSATKPRERATRRSAQCALRSRPKSSDCCRTARLKPAGSPKRWASASGLCRAGCPRKPRPSPRSSTVCDVASRLSTSKSRGSRWRKSPGFSVTRARRPSIMPSNVGRAARRPPPGTRSDFPSRHKRRLGQGQRRPSERKWREKAETWRHPARLAVCGILSRLASGAMRKGTRRRREKLLPHDVGAASPRPAIPSGAGLSFP